MIALTTVNWLTLASIVVGSGAFIGALVRVWQAKPETQTLVMSTGETGVKILDGVIDTLQSELARRDVAIDRYIALVDKRDEEAARMRAAYRELVESHRFELAERDARIAELTDRLEDELRNRGGDDAR